MITAIFDIEIQIDHVKGVNNTIAYLHSRLFSDKAVDKHLLQDLRENYQWFKILISHFYIDLHL